MITLKKNLRWLLIPALLFIYSRETSSQSVGVLTANDDGLQRPETWAQYNNTIRLATDYTICLRFKIKVFRLLTAVIYFFDVNDSDNDPVSFEVYFEKIRTKYGGYGKFYTLPYNLATNTWYHYCQQKDVANGEGIVYLNGEEIVREKINFENDPLTRRVFIGQDEFQAPYSFSGDLSQVNVWSRILTDKEVMNLAECKSSQEGNILKWSGDWTYNEIGISRQMSVREFCEGSGGGTQVVPLPSLRFKDSVTTCIALGGVIQTPVTEEQMKSELSHFKGREDCERQWGGTSDSDNEGIWFNPFTKEGVPSTELLFNGFADGDIHQNCARITKSGFKDTECKKSSCAACHVPKIATWTLRGICEEDERMNYLDLEPNPLSFRGYGEYAIKIIDGNWTWYDAVAAADMANFVPDKYQINYPLGRNMWELQSEVCGMYPGSMKELTLSKCIKGQFTCSDGSCIPFTSRCDLKFDCIDKTDERQCEIVNFPGDYRMNLPPRPQSNSALPIALNISIDTLNVDTEKMLLSASYNLRMTWFDNRLTYNNLKLLTRLNTLPLSQVDRLWRPLLGYINTDDIQQTAVDNDAVTTIVREGETFRYDLTNSYEVEIFSGDKNPVSTTRKYFTIYTCNFDLTLYPFDIQEVFMRIQILSASNEYLIFSYNDSNVEYLGSKFLVEYAIGKIAMTVDNSTQYAEARVTVELIRRYGYAMLNIYVPSLTLLIISCITLWFRPSIFEVRVMTSLTSLLVLATLFTQVSSSLPKTSYFKMVDIWLLFCIVVIFFIIIFHAIIDFYVDYGVPQYGVPVKSWVTDEKTEEKSIKDLVKFGTGGVKANKLRIWIFFARLLISSLFSIFNIIYWGTLAVNSGLVYQY